ncbi:MAG TPA: hypothetical protein VFS11_10285 [Gemmatimonadales bacterium]|nr:hypothetical protein [Gemmatimonadales bacterium]
MVRAAERAAHDPASAAADAIQEVTRLGAVVAAKTLAEAAARAERLEAQAQLTAASLTAQLELGRLNAGLIDGMIGGTEA